MDHKKEVSINLPEFILLHSFSHSFTHTFPKSLGLSDSPHFKDPGSQDRHSHSVATDLLAEIKTSETVSPEQHSAPPALSSGPGCL